MSPLSPGEAVKPNIVNTSISVTYRWTPVHLILCEHVNATLFTATVLSLYRDWHESDLLLSVCLCCLVYLLVSWRALNYCQEKSCFCVDFNECDITDSCPGCVDYTLTTQLHCRSIKLKISHRFYWSVLFRLSLTHSLFRLSSLCFLPKTS